MPLSQGTHYERTTNTTAAAFINSPL
jgi:hypothetical protein